MSNNTIDNLSFEEAAQELEAIAEKLENNSINLDEAIKLFARGTELKKHCDNKLQDAKLKVDTIIANGEKITGTKHSPLEDEYSK